MNDPVQRGLARLRAQDRAAARALADLIVDDALRTPVAQVARPRWIASQLAATLEAATHGDTLERWVTDRLAHERARWAAEPAPARAFVPPDLLDPLRDLLARPYAPDPSLVLRIVDQPAIRGLVRVVLQETVTRFRRRATEWDAGFLGGMGSRAVSRGRGLLGNLGGLVDAVREEVDHVLEGRVADFVQAATVEAVRTIASYAADPAHAAQFGELRVAILDVLLDTPARDLAREADALDLPGAVHVVVAALRALVDQPGFVDAAEARIGQILADAGDATLGGWLDEIGLRAAWATSTAELLADRIGAVAQTPAFEAWWRGLFTPELPT